MKTALLICMIRPILMALAAANGEQIVTPEDYGASGDGKSNDWFPIQQALAACASRPSYSNTTCRVVFAHNYRSGPLVLNSSSTTLEINGHLSMLPKKEYCQASPDSCAGKLGEAFISNAQGPEGCRDVAGGYKVCLSNVAVTGTGVISSGATVMEGLAWWSCARPIPFPNCWRPHLLVLSQIEGVRINGVTLLNAPNHNIEVQGNVHTRLQGLKIKAPYVSPNTDGVNFYGGFDSMIEDSVIDNGDDCVSIVPIGENEPYCQWPDPTDIRCSGGHVVVRNIECNGGHGLSIGGIRHGNVHNVTFENITATGGQMGCTQNEAAGGGCRIKSRPNSTGLVTDIHYKNIRFDGVYLPIQMTNDYCPFPCHSKPGNFSTLFANVSFDNVTGSGKQRSTVVELNCSPHAHCEDISMKRLSLVAKDGREGHVTCQNVASVYFDNKSLPSACDTSST